MPHCSRNLKVCHPERSTTASNASRRAQSKDPYPLSAFMGYVEAFFLCASDRVEENSLKQQNCIKPIGILRLRERLRARSAQDDNVPELTTDHWACP